MTARGDPPSSDLPGDPPGERHRSQDEDQGDAPLDAAGEERDLIRRAQAGEEHAFEALVQAHQRRAYGIARSLVPSDEDARDLAQEAFLRVFRSLDRFDFKYPFATWLHRIVTNLAIDHLRKRRLVLAGGRGDEEDDAPELEVVDEAQEAPSDRLEAIETAAAVREVIESLAPHFQRVLVLRELEGLPCTEIAELVGATHVTVRWRLHRGRKLFQEEWERRERLRELDRATAAGKPRASSNAGGTPS